MADPFGFTTPLGDYIILEKYNSKSKKGHIEVIECSTQK